MPRPGREEATRLDLFCAGQSTKYVTAALSIHTVLFTTSDADSRPPNPWQKLRPAMAVRWDLESGSRLPLVVLKSAARVTLKPLRPGDHPGLITIQTGYRHLININLLDVQDFGSGTMPLATRTFSSWELGRKRASQLQRRIKWAVRGERSGEGEGSVRLQR